MNAIFNLTNIAKLLFIALAIVVLWLVLTSDSAPTVEKSPKLITFGRTSDYSAYDFKMTVMDKRGKPAQIITGEKMFHYPDDDSTEILMTTARFIEPDNNDWLATADKASTQGKGNDILLTGHVVISQTQNNDIELTTDKLNLDTINNTAYTDSAATIKTPNGVTNTVGLHAALQDKTINLHSRVKGHYDAPTTD